MLSSPVPECFPGWRMLNVGALVRKYVGLNGVLPASIDINVRCFHLSVLGIFRRTSCVGLPGSPLVLRGLLCPVSLPPFFLGRYRRAGLNRGAAGSYYVLDHMPLLLGSPVAGGYGHHVAGAKGVVGVVDEEGFWIVEELIARKASRLTSCSRASHLQRLPTHLFKLSVPRLAPDADLHSPLHQPSCHHHAMEFPE